MSQAADPLLSKATKVARLQLAYKPGSSSSQRDVAECFELRISRNFPISVDFRHFPFPAFTISSFLVPGFTIDYLDYVRRVRSLYSSHRTFVDLAREWTQVTPPNFKWQPSYPDPPPPPEEVGHVIASRD